ncbi:MAG: sensor histidine kinase [Anaerolineaceae bacterium]|nr:sensor histidine kinase [Anaerolineaceae bacterium]
MEKHTTGEFNITSGTDLAFALVVLIAYFTTFSKPPEISLFVITVLICLGVAYIMNGIYGFAYINQSKNTLVKLLYFGSQLLIGGLIVFFSKGAGFTAFILLPLVAHTAMSLDQDWMLAVNASIFLTYVISMVGISGSWDAVFPNLPIFFVGQVFFLIFTQTAVNEQRGRMKMEKLAAELSEANRHLSEYASQVKDLTLSQERNRLAREIHDGLGHYLTTINMQIKASLVILNKDPNKAVALLENAKQLTTEALVDIRNSVSALRAESIDSLSLEERITNLAKSTETDERKFFVEILGNLRPLTPQMDVTLFRSVQEAINNANKHSKASEVHIVLDFTNSELINLRILDNGVGSDNFDGGFGLIGMRERVKLIQGEIKFTSTKGEGFEIQITVPG